MGMYHYIQETFQDEYHERSPIYRARISKWRQEGSIVRAERPTNIARARTSGSAPSWSRTKSVNELSAMNGFYRRRNQRQPGVFFICAEFRRQQRLWPSRRRAVRRGC